MVAPIHCHNVSTEKLGTNYSNVDLVRIKRWLRVAYEIVTTPSRSPQQMMLALPPQHKQQKFVEKTCCKPGTVL